MEDPIRQGRRMYELGRRLGALGAVAIGSAGGPLAQALARTAGVGAALAGGEVRFHDGRCAACAAWLARYYRLPASLFLRQQGREVTVWVLDGQGRLFEPPALPTATPAWTGEWDLLVGVEQAWAAHRAGRVHRAGPLCARGPEGLVLALERMGYELVPARPGIPVLRSDREGFSLQVELDGSAAPLPGEDALAAAAAWVPPAQLLPASQPGPRLI
ncbi:MAG TPA: hypothetical protein IAC21_02765 [Candidatus Enterenecus merdae]|nr:hypothetical protein [Candidatus Enterenecus merdae]